MRFQWIPHRGANRAAIKRMKQHFVRPRNDPHEAWFNTSVQRYYHGLLEALTTKPDLSYIEEFLFDVGGGIKNFGRFEEWVEWFQYLFPYLLEHILEGRLLALSIDFFLNLYPERLIAEYPGFREEVLLTLPQSIMEGQLWQGQDLSKQHRWFAGPDDNWPSPLYSTMFFCIKYLRHDEIRTWITSIASIQGELWQIEISRWLTGASRFLHYVRHAQEIPETDANLDNYILGTLEYPLEAAGISWDGSHLVFCGQNASKSLSDYWPQDNIETFWNEIQKYPHLSSG
jgi:hypothetical protein